MNDATPDLPATTESGEKSFYIHPQDQIEEELLIQMEHTSHAIERCFELGNNVAAGFSSKMGYLGLAAKLMRSYAASVRALNHHSGKGKIEQKIIVQYQHIHVDDGGQAIVGGVTPRQGGGRQKTENQPQKKQINYDSQFTMPGPDAQRRPMPISSNGEW
jgi:hypothetical protein